MSADGDGVEIPALQAVDIVFAGQYLICLLYTSLIWNFLNHPETARNTLQSKDTVELYLALWSIGFYDTDEIRAIVPDIIRKGATLYSFT